MKISHRIALRTVGYGLVRAITTAIAGVYEAFNAVAADHQRTLEQLIREDHEQRRATCTCMACSLTRAQIAAEKAAPGAAPKGAN